MQIIATFFSKYSHILSDYDYFLFDKSSHFGSMYALTGDGENTLSYLDEQLSRTEILTGRNTRRVRFNACRTAGGEVVRIGDAGSGSVDDDAGEADTLTCVVVRGEGQRCTSGKRLRIRPCIVAEGLTIDGYDRRYLGLTGFDIEVTILRTAIGADIHFDRRETGKFYLRRGQLFAFIDKSRSSKQC